MADITEQKGENLDAQMEIKVEPTLQGYVEEEHENGFPGFESAINTVPSSADIGALNLWTSKATACLISQYKKYRSMVGQSTQIRSLREMFEMISIEMRKHGFHFSPQKCENKWRVLERKYKNLVFRERLKKPGRMRHYGQWEHKRALDEIFKEKKKHMYLEESDFPSPTGSARCRLILPKHITAEQTNIAIVNQQQEDFLPTPGSDSSANNKNAALDHKETLTILFEKFLDEMTKHFAGAEKSREERHREKMAMRQSELEVQKRILKLKEQKLELQKRQIIAAAQHVHLSM
ncbi:uncharacterized protein LOC143425853 isoform X2 [Xylocopa sonorina]|uniref:uncharacterized protein LOC143425853 isoform X2 n=1 Tax=Xylocopa sonorina TaxID=1818115 RepID=UPI00403B1504